MNMGFGPGSFGPASPAQSSGFDLSSMMTRVFGLSMFASMFAGSEGIGGNSLKLIMLGVLVEFGRRFVQWIVERFRLQYSITAEFSEGDPAYDWIINFITQEKVWRRSRDFRVNARSSQRRWAISTASDSQIIDSAEYVPTYDLPQLFWWKRYWIEIKRTKGQAASMSPFGGVNAASGASMFLTIYTLDMTVLSRLIEEAKKKYFEVSRPHVIVHSVTAHSYGPKFYWNNVKQKPRRPLSSIILPGDTLTELIADIQDFLKMEDWYMTAGIPHRRGYLLFGPPGTGKSSTIHAIAGEIKMEIYAISLAAHFIDDTFLEQAVSSVPKGSILLIEDIDCAFSREDDEDEGGFQGGMLTHNKRRSRRSAVTLSGLLNILDGVGSEEGKIFFATTNHVDNLDPALLRPGRIDRKIEYKLATHAQGAALFDRFYPIKHVTPEPLVDSSNEKVATDEEKIAVLRRLNDDFTSHIPEHEFSTAELQGFLLSCKMMPEKAAKTIQGWVADERRQREEKQARIDAKKRKHTERQEKMEVEKFQSTLAKIGGGVGPGHTQINGTGEKKVSDTPLPPTVANGSVVPPAAAKLNGTKTTIVNGSDSGGTRVNGSAPTSDGAHNA